MLLLLLRLSAPGGGILFACGAVGQGEGGEVAKINCKTEETR